MQGNWFGMAFLAGALALSPVVSAQPQDQGKGYGPGQGPGQGMGPGQGPGRGQGMMGQRWMRERMFGTPLMTLEERQAHMTKMWNAKTVGERNRIRDEHRSLMLQRARERQQQIDEKQDDIFSVPEVR